MDPSTVRRALDWLSGAGPFPRPVSIHMDLTLRCNARCAHCRQWTWPDQPEMDLPQLEQAIQVLREWGVQTITLGGGNPLLHCEVIPALDLLHAAGIRIGIITEGTQMTDALVEAVAARVDWIRFSIDGPTAAVHDQIRGVPGLFDQAMENIRRLLEAKPDLPISVNCVVQRLNLAHLDAMRPMAEAHGIGMLQFKAPHGQDRHHRYLLEADEWAAFTRWVEQAAEVDGGPVRTNLSQLRQMVREVFNPDDAVQGVPVRTFYTAGGIRCFVPFFLLVIDSQGDAYPCDYLQADTRPWKQYARLRAEYRLGNILTSPGAIIERLEVLMRETIPGLPAAGNEECGCCTRFAQLNAWLARCAAELPGETAGSTDARPAAPFL